MGQKVNPNGFRVGVIRDWNARWYASKKDFADFLVEDNKIRSFVKKKYYAASISRIDIERAAGKISVSIHTARPGLLIGKGGAGIDEIKSSIAKEVGKAVNVNIMEVRNADADAQLVAVTHFHQNFQKLRGKNRGNTFQHKEASIHLRGGSFRAPPDGCNHYSTMKQGVHSESRLF